MAGPGEPVLDGALRTDGAEDVGREAALGFPVMLDEPRAVVGQHRVDPVGNGPGQSFQEAGGDELRRVPIDPGEDQLRCPVDGDEEVGLAAFVAQFGDIDVKIADLASFEALGLLAIRFR